MPRYMPRTPPLYDARDKYLFRIVGYIWTNAINDFSEVAVEASNDFWGCHCRLESIKDFGNRGVKKLTFEFSKRIGVRVGPFRCGHDEILSKSITEGTYFGGWPKNQ
jgi:hypothetical protein